MISVGIRRFDSGFGVGDMEETELEEGEAFSYHDNDGYDESIDPDTALSYIDEKLQNVLGHFQKDFEGGVSAENLGAKFGGYGSFLPTYQRSPIDSHPRTPAKVQNYNSPRSPNSSQLEVVFHPSAVSSTTSQSVRPAPASTSATSLPAPKPPRSTEELAPRNESVNRKSSKLSDQKTLKVRLKLGSDHLSSQRNAEIYSGLGLDVSPSSSLDESPSGSEGMVHEDVPNESPNSILQIMTSFAVPGNLLLSPLPNDLLHLTEKTKFMKDGRFMPVAKGLENPRIPVIGSDSMKGDRKMLGEKKIKPVAKSEFSAETNSGIKDVKKEAIVEEKKISPFNNFNFSAYSRKDGQRKEEKIFDSVKAESDVSKTREAIHGTKLPTEKESSSNRKSKGTHHIRGNGKESSKLGSSIPKSKKNPKNGPQDLKARKEIVKAREAYRDFFGELDEQDHQMDASEIPFEDRLKERLSSKRTDKPSTSEANPKPVSNIAPHPTIGPNPDGLPSLGGTQFIQENWVGCDKCQQWRLLPLGTNPEDLPDKWTCSMLNWLPNMNRCSITEEETTKALLALYQVPTAENQNYVHNSGGFWSQSYQNYGSHDMPGGGKKNHGLEITNSMSRDGPDPTKKTLHTSFIKSSDKEKQKGTERYFDGGDTKSLKVKSKRDTDQDCFRASKKVKTESEHYADEDWKLDHGRANGKDTSQVFVKKTKEEADGSLDLGNYDDRMIAPKKRKVKEGHDPKIHLDHSVGHRPEDRIGVVEEEFSENEFRTSEKKARVSKPDGKESKISQRNSDGNDYVKRDLGSTLAATSSSSKISGSRKTKAAFQEAKGSPVESVSSSPMRILDVRRNLDEKHEDARKSKDEVIIDGSRLKKSGKGSSSRSKDKSRREKHEDVRKSKSEVSASVNDLNNAAKPREGKNKFLEMSRLKPDENSKRDGVSSSGARDGPDAKTGAIRSQDPLSIPKQPLQNRDVQRSSKRPEKNDQKSSASGKGRPVPLPPSPLKRDSSTHAASSALQEAKDLKHRADRIKNTESEMERIDLYFEAVLKFLRASSLLESSNSESGKHGEMIQAMQIYSSTAKLCDFCAHEYEKQKNAAFAALAYKCTEVAYMRVIYSSHSGASRDRHEVQMALQMVPPGESPSSSASDIDNLNNPSTADKLTMPKSVGSPQVAGNHIIAAKTRPNLLRLLNFTQDVHLAMEASRKSRAAFAAANASFSDAKYKEGIASVRRALDFSFQDIEGFLRLVKLAMEAFNP